MDPGLQGEEDAFEERQQAVGKAGSGGSPNYSQKEKRFPDPQKAECCDAKESRRLTRQEG